MSEEQIKAINEKIILATNELEDRLIEREELIKLVILAIFSKSHMFLIGERGVGKSLAIRLFGELVDKAKYWELQVGNDTKSKQIFGKIKEAKNGTYYYQGVNTILDAHFAFLDEMFKAKSEVLNMLLQLMADRYYTTGDGRMIDVPLISLFGASNEYPTGKLAEPYLDRLLFWYDVKRIENEENRLKYFAGDFNQEPIKEPIFNVDEILAVNAESKKIVIEDDVLRAFNNIVNQLILQGVKTSDRKYFNTIKAMKTSALLNNRKKVNFSELFLFTYTSWHDDIEKRKTEEVIYTELFSNTVNLKSKIEDITKQVESIETEKNSAFSDFFKYKTIFEGINASEQYERYIQACYIVVLNYNTELKKVEHLANTIENIYSNEKLIENNIFLMNIKNNSLTPEIIQSVSTIGMNIRNKTTEIEEFILENRELLDYRENCLSR